MHVALAVPCFGPVLRPSDTTDARRVLEALGDEVTLLSGQCCGQAPFNSGFRDDARTTGREFLRAAQPFERVVLLSGSCTAMVQHYLPSLFEPPRDAGASAIAHRTIDFASYVAGHPNLDSLTLRLEGTVAYHDSCHSRRELKATAAAVRCIESIDGLELRRLLFEDECCGFGGSFSVKLPEVSTEMLRSKLNVVAATGARVLVSADLSCLTHIQAGADGTGQALETWTLPELLAKALA